MNPLRLLVVGAGYMGGLHARKIASLPGELELVGICDHHLDRATTLAGSLGVRAAEDPLALSARADAAVVSVPTVAHAAVVRTLLDSGLDVLVEKPIAATLPEAQALLDRARAAGRVLVVGHIEWHNPALRAMRPRIHRPRFVEAHRMGPFPGRATDVDIVRDLMIHDLDVVQRLVGEEPEAIDGVGVPVLSQQLDIANARLRFPGGCVANFTASRVSPTPLRKIRFFQADGYFSIDFLEHAAVIVRRTAAPGTEPRIEVEPIRFDPDDALVAQLRAFASAARAGRDDSGSAEAGLRALRTALRVIDAMPPLEALA
jgi:predicted dehydrogenase